MTDRIVLSGLEVRARHGVLPEERRSDQLFVVDVEISLDVSSIGDSLDDTVDYGTLAQRIHELVAGESHNLIETVANRVAALVLEDHRVKSARVTVHKPEAPIDLAFGDVSVTVDRYR